MTFIQLPSRQEYFILGLSLLLWLGVTALFIGFRPEHIGMAILITLLFCVHSQTRKLVVALLPFALFGISYDWMRIFPNYEVNPIHVQQLYETEKHLFGIWSNQTLLTPNEFFALHHSPILDFLSGIWYLCWVPVPILFGIGLYFTHQRATYLRFAWVFLLVNLIGFTGYYIYPAAPPWYVAKYGFDVILQTPGDVAGLGRFDAMTGLSIFNGIYARNANVFAAVPSLHSAYMVVTLYYALQTRTALLLKWLFGFIMFGIWFTAVYTSHHYLIDVLLGICCACLGIFLFEFILSRYTVFSRWLKSYTAYIE